MYCSEKVILKTLYGLSDENRAAFNKKICMGSRPHLGVRVPDLRKIAKQAAQYDYNAFLSCLGEEYYEQILLRGLTVAYANMSLYDREKAVYEYLKYVDCWGLVDSVVCTYKVKPKDSAEYLNFINELIADGREFVVRFGFVSLIVNYVSKEYLDVIFDLADKTEASLYNVSMAVAWLLSVCMAKYPIETEKYLYHAKINDITYNRTIDKIRDSFRVDKALKDKLKLTKRK